MIGSTTNKKGENMSIDVVGSVSTLWRFPVKSMRGEQLEEVEVTDRGLVGDRAYALIEADTGKVVSAKSVKRFPRLLACRATFLEKPQPGRTAPPVQIDLPDGTSITSDSAQSDGALSQYFRQNLRLARAAPKNFTIDMFHPDLGEHGQPDKRDQVVDQKLGAALFAELGLASPVPEGSFFDVFPITVLTTSTLDKLNQLQPQSRFDQRRFRMNIVIDSKEPGFIENKWVGRELRVGENVRLRVEVPDSRCVMTTLAQGELPKDPEILKGLARHNRIQVGNFGEYPCAGVYAIVTAPGTIREGDSVELL